MWIHSDSTATTKTRLNPTELSRCIVAVVVPPPATKPEPKFLAKPNLAKSRWKKLAGTAMFINRLGKIYHIIIIIIIIIIARIWMGMAFFYSKYTFTLFKFTP